MNLPAPKKSLNERVKEMMNFSRSGNAPKYSFMDQLRTKGKTVLVTSHIYDSLTGCCDFIHYMDGGRIARTYGQEEFHLLKEELQSLIEQRSTHLISELLAGNAVAPI